jgi:two-component sensor histidine kinase
LRTRTRDGDVAERLELVVSELVANAVLHGAEPIELALDERDSTIRVEVSDANPALPPPPGSRDAHAFGLRVVEHLVRRAGAQPHADDGKTVWAEL